MGQNEKPEGPTGPVGPLASAFGLKGPEGSTLFLHTPSAGRAVADTVIVTGKRNITGTGNLVVGSTGTVVGRDIKITTENEKQILSVDQAFERIGAGVKVNLDQFQLNLSQARNESSNFLKLTMVFVAVGFATIVVGVGLLLGHQIAAGVVSTIASVIPGATAALFFKKDKELRGTIERYHQHVLDSQRLLTMIDVAETVKNEDERDSLKREIIFNALGIKKTRKDLSQ
jgi:hypothetical protein